MIPEKAIRDRVVAIVDNIVTLPDMTEDYDIKSILKDSCSILYNHEDYQESEFVSTRATLSVLRAYASRKKLDHSYRLDQVRSVAYNLALVTITSLGGKITDQQVLLSVNGSDDVRDAQYYVTYYQMIYELCHELIWTLQLIVKNK